MINVQKSEQMRLNQSSTLSFTDLLAIEGQPINIVDDFKYLVSYVGSTQRDVKFRTRMGSFCQTQVNIKVTE